jgi:hypothetical protein
MLLLTKDLRVRHTQDNFPYKIWIVRVHSHALWIDENTYLLHVPHEQGVYEISGQVHSSLH